MLEVVPAVGALVQELATSSHLEALARTAVLLQIEQKCEFLGIGVNEIAQRFANNASIKSNIAKPKLSAREFVCVQSVQFQLLVDKLAQGF